MSPGGWVLFSFPSSAFGLKFTSAITSAFDFNTKWHPNCFGLRLGNDIDLLASHLLNHLGHHECSNRDVNIY